MDAGREHVAIINARVARVLLRGTKHVETRFSRRRRVPFGCVQPGDTLHFKVSGGKLLGTARVLRVRDYSDLTPTNLAAIRNRYRKAIGADRAYWRARRHCSYGTLIWFGAMSPPAGGVAIPRQYGNGWVVLPPRRSGKP